MFVVVIVQHLEVTLLVSMIIALWQYLRKGMVNLICLVIGLVIMKLHDLLMHLQHHLTLIYVISSPETNSKTTKLNKRVDITMLPFIVIIE